VSAVTHVKVCGLTTVEDARLAVRAGADAIGINLIRVSKRRVDSETADRIVRAVAGRVITVAVVADLPLAELRRLRSETGVDLLQLHGSEPPDVLEALLPNAYQAIRVGTRADVERAAAYRGDRILVDAKVEGQLGGTGVTFDWSLVRELAQKRRLVLAGGLDPDNVAAAVAGVSPWGVDVASGVEVTGEPRRKDAAKLERFVAEVRTSRAPT
jgi:phosphoribosylanthranilate isomerase